MITIQMQRKTKVAESHDHSHDHQAAGASNFSNDLYNSPEMEAYVHAHDDADIANFFDAKTKSLLKQALANMWESELYLRTYKPKQALPYAYKALKLIKEVQQATRVYVERIGFEPPPLEPLKKRLTGELDDINPNRTSSDTETLSITEKKLLFIYEALSQSDFYKSTEKQQNLSELAAIVASEIHKNPLIYGKLLAFIAQYKQRESAITFSNILRLLNQILPDSETLLNGKDNSQLKINDIFMQTKLN